MAQVDYYSRRTLKPIGEAPLQRDEERKTNAKRQQLRLRLYCNGDRFFKGKKVCLDPRSFHSFTDFLNTLNSHMPADLYLPNGVRQIYTPKNGNRVVNMESLKDGSEYVLAGNESFKPIKYGSHALEPWGKGQSQNQLPYSYRFGGRYGPHLAAADDSHYAGYNAFPPSRFYRQVRNNRYPYLAQPGASHASRYKILRGEPESTTTRSNELPGAGAPPQHVSKPRVITVVQSGPRSPRKVIKVLLNRRSVQPFEQLMCDISDQFGAGHSVSNPSSHRGAVGTVVANAGTKLFTVRGREVQGISDFFREDDMFIWVPTDSTPNQPLGIGLHEVSDILRDIYPDKDWQVRTLIKEWERRYRRADRIRRKQQEQQHPQHPQTKRTAMGHGQKNSEVQQPSNSLASLPLASSEDDKRDSGFDESDPLSHSHAYDDKDETSRSTYRGLQTEFPPLRSDQDMREDRLKGRGSEDDRRRHGLPLLRQSGANKDIRRQLQQDKLERRNMRRQQAMELERKRQRQLRQAEEEQQAAETVIRQRRQEAKEAREREAKEKAAREKEARLQEARERKLEEERLAAQRLEEERLAAEAEAERKRRLHEKEAAERRRRQKAQAAAPAPVPAPAASPPPAPAPDKGPDAPTEPVPVVEEEQSARGPEPDLQPEQAPAAAEDKEKEEKAAQEQEEEERKKREAEEAEERLRQQREKFAAAEAAARRRAEEAEAAEAKKKKEKEEAARAAEQHEKENANAETIETKPAEPVATEDAGEANKENRETPVPPVEVKVKAPSPVKMTADEKRSTRRASVQRAKGGKIMRQYSRAEHVLDKYDLGKVMGDGNFAVVRACRKRESGNEYAIKIIDKSKLRGRENMIENEIDIMRTCSHANIVKLREEYETPAEIFLVMELVKGGDLFDAITQSVKFSEPQSASMVNDLTQALFYLHSRMIVHRDLKPENLLVVRNKNGTLSLKLADFGLAMEVKRLIYTVCGTPTYVAPEILSETGYGLEVDLWALGVITYILLCGFPPFRSPERKQTELFEMIKSGRFEYLSPYWDNISSSAKDLISHLLVVDRKRRYTAIDVLCHPWVITVAGSFKLNKSVSEYRQTLRRDLETRAKADLDDFRASRNASQSLT